MGPGKKVTLKSVFECCPREKVADEIHSHLHIFVLRLVIGIWYMSL